MAQQTELNPVEKSNAGIALRIFSWIVGLSGACVGAPVALMGTGSSSSPMGIWAGAGIALGAFVLAAILSSIGAICDHAEITAKNSVIQTKLLSRAVRRMGDAEVPFSEV